MFPMSKEQEHEHELKHEGYKGDCFIPLDFCKTLLIVILTAYSEQLVVTFTKPLCFPANRGCVTHVLRPKSQELGKN